MSKLKKFESFKGKKERAMYPLILIVVLIVWGSLMGVSASASESVVDSCITIDSSGVYNLNESLSSDSTCINITSSDVVFDGNGYIISGLGSAGESYCGINVHNSGVGLENVTVRNIELDGWYSAICYQTVSEGKISGTATKNNEYGIYLFSSHHNDLTQNKATNNEYGIALSNSDNNVLGHNYVWSNSNIGIHFYNSQNNLVFNTTCSNNQNIGMFLYHSSKNDLGNNTCTHNFHGTFLLYSNNNKLENSAASNNNYGIALSNSDNNMIINGSLVEENTNSEVFIYRSENTTMYESPPPTHGTTPPPRTNDASSSGSSGGRIITFSATPTPIPTATPTPTSSPTSAPVQTKEQLEPVSGQLTPTPDSTTTSAPHTPTPDPTSGATTTEMPVQWWQQPMGIVGLVALLSAAIIILIYVVRIK